MDIRNQPYVEIKDLYTKDGKHVSSVCKTPDGRILWEEGPKPNKDIWFVPHLAVLPPWNRTDEDYWA